MTTRRRFTNTAVGGLALAGCGISPSTASNSRGPITFGVSGPFTGDDAEYGQTWKKAWVLVLDDVNGKGGVIRFRPQALWGKA
jgi:branched-chain amino acid transport system substrate-binding protein